MKEVESDKDGWTKVKRKDGSKGLVPTVYLKGRSSTSNLRKHQLLVNFCLPDASTPRQAAPQRPPATNKSPFRAIPRDLNEEILQHPGKMHVTITVGKTFSYNSTLFNHLPKE